MLNRFDSRRIRIRPIQTAQPSVHHPPPILCLVSSGLHHGAVGGAGGQVGGAEGSGGDEDDVRGVKGHQCSSVALAR